MPLIPQYKTNHRQGFTLLETVFALIVFAMMGLLFSAVLPASQRAARVNAHYTQAAALAQHKIAQIRAAGFSSVQSPATLAALGIVDSGTATSTSVPYSASFIAADHLIANTSGNGMFVAGTTATVSAADYTTVNASVPAGTISIVTVKLSWPGDASSSGSYTMSGLVIQMPHT